MDDAIGTAQSARMQRFLRGAVAVLLTANGFALALVATDDPAPPTQAEQGTRTVTLIQQADGTTTRVDPSTPAGRAAIEQARRSGATITQTTVPVSSDEGEDDPTKAPAATNGADGTDGSDGWSSPLTDVLGGATDTVNQTVDGVQSTVDGVVDGVQQTVNDTVGSTPLDGTVDQVQEQTGSTVDQVQQTVDGAVQDPVGTVTGTVDTVTGTVDGLSGGSTGGTTSTVTETVTGTVGGLPGL